MKIALVQDWLTTLGGAEKVFRAIYDLYPDADIFTLIYNEELLEKLNIPKNKVKASYISKLPFAKSSFRNYLPLFSKAIESFDLSQYDLIISSSFCVAKGVLTHSNQLHICYCHSPVRYAWDLYFQYLTETNLTRGIKSSIVKNVLHKLRIWDVISSNRVDYFISNSDYIRNRINKVYRREAVTIYPNVEVGNFTFRSKKDEYYITCSRLVPYKKIDLIVKAFAQLPDKRLIVIGSGPDYDKIKSFAGANIEMLGYQSFEVLEDMISKAKAFVFAAEEDFGIAPVEAQACGTPVIAFGKGGSLETIVDNQTGLFFYEQSEKAIIDSILRFENMRNEFDADKIRKNAERFDTEIFKMKFRTFVDAKILERQNKPR